MQTRSRKKNPGLYWTRKEAVSAAIERADSGTDLLNRRGEYFVVGGSRRWGIVTRRPNGPSFGPITSTNSEQYRRWYCS